MKLCGSEDCGCFVASDSPNLSVRGSGGAGVPMHINWLLFPRAAEVSMSAMGTRYWVNGSGHKMFSRLPFRLTRNSARSINSTSNLSYATGINTAEDGQSAPPASVLTTDPEFAEFIDADAGLAGIVTLSSDYDSYDVTLELLYVNMQNYDGFTWTVVPPVAVDTTLNDPYTSRHLEVYPRTLVGSSGTQAARIPLHAHSGYKAALHAPKVPMVRLPFHVTHGHSWSFTVTARSIVADTGGFDVDTSPVKTKIGVYGLLSVYE